MSKRIVFIAWNQNQSGAFKTDTERNERLKGETHSQRTWSNVFLDSPGTPLADIGMGVGTRIHIAGHGAIGDPNVAADHGTGGADRSYTEIVELMIQKGLKKIYTGTIACDVCYSALGSPPFARLLAREFWKQGYKLVNVLGYKGSLYAQYRTLGGKYTHRRVELEDGTKVKSSSAQVRFFGWM